MIAFLDFSPILILIFTTCCIFGEVSGRKECPKRMRHYEELKCIPKIDEESGCAVSYDCGSIAKRKKDKCYYLEKEYSIGEEMPSPTQCHKLCSCILDDRARPQCVSADCWWPPYVEDGCGWLNIHDKCCPIKKCGNKIFDGWEGEGREVMTCEYDGEVLMEGEEFYPKGHVCKKCSCKTGFNGTLVSPFCEDRICNIEFFDSSAVYRGCSPVYYDSEPCCPLDWHCPEDGVTTIHKLTIKKETGGPKCKFGKFELDVGQRLSSVKKFDCIECVCEVPPMLSCTIKKNCQAATRLRENNKFDS